MEGTSNTSTVEPDVEPDFIREWARARARALRFLATRTAALGGVYSISVTSTGEITLQGKHGALQDLVQMWGAQQSPDDEAAVPAGYREWKVAVGDPAVRVRLVEEGQR